ncbi:MAG: DUF2834 domain-containing protein [Pseudanabaenaceae cyanobacterium bins.68]|nr:DUF2834 domain-containing protein [Pseudanabaenaceae cyanobacterium bins.68]
MSAVVRQVSFGLLWLSFGIYAFGFAPPEAGNTSELIQDLIAGKWQQINPVVVALFNLMGVLPAMYAAILFADGKGQKVPASWFVLLSFGIGAFGLLPYFALRQPNPTFDGTKNFWIRFWDSRLTGLGLTAIAITLLIYGLKTGDFGANWADYVVQFRTNRFIHVMTLDFGLLCLLFSWILADDMRRRGLTESGIFQAVTLVPLLGVLVYLCVRPNLPEPLTQS